MRIFCPAIAVFCSCRSVSVLAGNAGWSQTSSGLAPAGRVVLHTGRATRGRAAAQGCAAARREVLLDDLGDATGADGAATLTDGEPEALLHGDRLDQPDPHLGVVARPDPLRARPQGHHAGDAQGPEVELRTVV